MHFMFCSKIFFSTMGISTVKEAEEDHRCDKHDEGQIMVGSHDFSLHAIQAQHRLTPKEAVVIGRLGS